MTFLLGVLAGLPLGGLFVSVVLVAVLRASRARYRCAACGDLFNTTLLRDIVVRSRYLRRVGYLPGADEALICHDCHRQMMAPMN